MSLEHCAGKLMRGFKDFKQHWFQLKSQWHDKRSERFEREYIVPLEAAVRQSLAGLEELNDAMMQAKKLCEKDDIVYDK